MLQYCWPVMNNVNLREKTPFRASYILLLILIISLCGLPQQYCNILFGNFWRLPSLSKWSILVTKNFILLLLMPLNFPNLINLSQIIKIMELKKYFWQFSLFEKCKIRHPCAPYKSLKKKLMDSWFLFSVMLLDLEQILRIWARSCNYYNNYGKKIIMLQYCWPVTDNVNLVFHLCYNIVDQWQIL